MSLLDTGAEISLLSLRIAHLWNLRLNKTELSIALAVRGATQPYAGITEPLKVCCEEIEIEASFVVFDLPSVLIYLINFISILATRQRVFLQLTRSPSCTTQKSQVSRWNQKIYLLKYLLMTTFCVTCQRYRKLWIGMRLQRASSTLYQNPLSLSTLVRMHLLGFGSTRSHNL
eukprot:Pompholyxophrys_punicea_v1_NODE_19_length_5902_cov_21.503677.p4 type:complete len:173 gc:universal NODE_19_length_5902_cov_21.503677:3665-3147(-)